MSPRATRKRGYSQVELPKTPVEVEKNASTAEPASTSNGGAVQSIPTSEASTSTAITEPADPPVITKKLKVREFKEERCSHCDSDSEYEPVKVLKGCPKVRDPTELPVITENHGGERKILWCKMDTGADVNIVSFKVIERLGFTNLIEGCESSLREIGGNGIHINRKIVLSFWAGRKNHHCKNVVFFIPSEEQDTDHDGVADVLLGMPELRKHHMVMVDPDFCNDPEDGLEVLAKRACEEVPDAEEVKGIFLGTKYPQIKVRK
jgi:hypothetical protein